MKRLLLLVLTLILALPVFAHAEEDIVGFFLEPTTETSVLFPGVPDWSTVAASEDSAAAFAALALMDLERGCDKNGYEYPSDYDDVYLWTLDGTVYLTVYADVSVSMFVMDSGEWMVLMAVNREVADNAAEWVEMQLASGEMEDAIHITPEMLERGTLTALAGSFYITAIDFLEFDEDSGIAEWGDMLIADSGEIVEWGDMLFAEDGEPLTYYGYGNIGEMPGTAGAESDGSMIYEFGTTRSEEAADTEFEIFGSLTETDAEFPELPSWEKLNGIPALATQYANALIADFERICEMQGIVIPGDYSKAYLAKLNDDMLGVALLVFGEVNYVITAQYGVLFALTMEEDMQGMPAEEILPVLLESGDIVDYDQVAVSGSSTYVPDNSQGEGVGVFTLENYRAKEFLFAYSQEDLLADENLAAEMAGFVIEDLEAGCEQNGYAAPAGYDRVFLWTTADGMYLTIYSQMSYAVLLSETQMIVLIAVNDYVAENAHEHMAYMLESGQLNEYLYIPERLVFGTAASTAPAVTAPERPDNLPAAPARFACAADAYNACMAPPIRWSNVAGDEAAAADLAEIILQDAALGLADCGFESEAVKYAIIRGIKDVPVLYVSMGGGMWLLMPSSTGMTAVWTPDHPAAVGDPAEFAENAMESGDVYYILTGEGISAGEIASVPDAVGNAPAESGEYYVPATFTRRAMPFPTYWEDIADDPDRVALMAAAILQDADEGLAEYGFDSAAAEYFILFNLTDFPQLYVSMNGGMWTLLPQSSDLMARWTPNHNAAGEDPVEFAEWSLEITAGLIEAYFVLTPDEIERGCVQLRAGTELREGDDWVSKFRMADNVYKYNSGYAPFVYQQQAAFISAAGDVLMAGEIDGARPFDEYGFAPVYQGPYTSGMAYGGLWGIVDTKGSFVFPFSYSSIEITDDGVYSMPIEGGRAFFDPATMVYVELTGYSEVGWQCSEGMIPIANGLLDESGKEVGKLWGYINMHDGTTLDYRWESVSYTWTDGCAYVQQGGKYGVINRMGEVLIPCEWDGCEGIGEGFAVMIRDLPPEEGLNQNDFREFVVVELNGNEIVSFEAYTVDIQKVPGYIAVYRSFDNEGGLYTISGEEVLPMEYHDIFMYSETQVLLAQEDAQGETFHGVYDPVQGVWLTEMQWEDGRPQPGDGYYRVKKDGLYGFLNEEFELVIPPQYEDAEWFSDGYAAVKQDGMWMFIDKAGQIAF